MRYNYENLLSRVLFGILLSLSFLTTEAHADSEGPGWFDGIIEDIADIVDEIIPDEIIEYNEAYEESWRETIDTADEHWMDVVDDVIPDTIADYDEGWSDPVEMYAELQETLEEYFDERAEVLYLADMWNEEHPGEDTRWYDDDYLEDYFGYLPDESIRENIDHSNTAMDQTETYAEEMGFYEDEDNWLDDVIEGFSAAESSIVAVGYEVLKEIDQYSEDYDFGIDADNASDASLDSAIDGIIGSIFEAIYDDYDYVDE